MTPLKKDDELPPRLTVARGPGIRFPNEDGAVESVDAWSQAFSSAVNEGDHWHRVDIERIPFPIWVRLGMSIEDGFVVTGMLLGDPDGRVAIGTGALNKIAVNEILESVARIDQADDVIRETAYDFVGEVRRPGGQTTDNESIREAARAYVYATTGGISSVITSVAAALRVSRATASRRIQKARDLGLIAEESRRYEGLSNSDKYAEARAFGLEGDRVPF